MFSEYASKFLSQSQSRLSLAQGESPFKRHAADQQRPTSRSRSRAPTNYASRRNIPNPYGSQAMSRFAFASRVSNAPAPLFYSATDEFREEMDHEEHDRELADHFALQRSRRQFGASNLSESSEAEDESNPITDRRPETAGNDAPGYGLGQGIKSSWNGEQPLSRGRSAIVTNTQPEIREQSVPLSESSAPSSKGKGKLVDVELESTDRDSVEDVDRDELMRELEERPPSYQQIRSASRLKRTRSPLRTTLSIPQEADEDTFLRSPRPRSPDRESVPQEVVVEPGPSPRHNFFWADVFAITQCFMMASFVAKLIWESPPDKKHPLGDTIYTVLHSSFHLIATYTMVSIAVGLIWLSLLRSYARTLVRLMLIAVPVISFSFFLYPFISSYKGSWHGHSLQDKAMRWMSVVPLLLTFFWCYTVWKARHSLDRAASMLEFSVEILKAQSPLLFVGIGTLTAVVLWSWLWMLMFTRLFLSGHFSKTRWMIDPSTWWIGAAFFLDYFWTLSVISGIQRATTAATVSQWYFHRNTVPAPAAYTVVRASLHHAAYTMSGTICLSTLLSLLIRLPLILLPRRLAGLVSMCAYSIIPTPIAAMTNPLTLTYASIHSVPLALGARGLSSMTFVSASSPTTTLGPRSFAPSHPRPSLVSYRLAKLLLHAIRWVMTLSIGFGGWVSTARMLQLRGDSISYKGSMYAYIIGLISAAIGWGALGAMEGVVGCILDALLVCWGSEVGQDGTGEARYCVDAGRVFGNEDIAPGRGRYDV